MREEITNWWRQAEEDYETAKFNFDGKKYYIAAFLCQQAVEKALKALILLRSKDKDIEGHSLVHLGKRAEVPRKFYPGLKKLSPQYVIARYPDISEDVPFELYDEKTVGEFMGIAGEVMEWIRKQLK